MKITRLSTAVIESNYDWTIVRLDTDERLSGFGEAYLGPGITAVIREFAPVLEGQDPTSPDRLLRRLRACCVHASPGLVWHALSGIEAALFDLLGKHYKMPVWQMLGGKFRDRVRIYADCHAGEALESLGPLAIPRTPSWALPQGAQAAHGVLDLKHHGWNAGQEEEHILPEAYAQRARAMAEQGFTALKFDLDVPSPYEGDEYNRRLTRAEMEYAVSLAAAARNAVDPAVEIALDCHWAYGVDTAIDLARMLEPLPLLWLEDPVPPENIPALAAVQKATALPLTTGENHYQAIDFDRLIREAGLRVLSPDLQKVGFREGARIAQIADMHYVALAPHNISSPLGTMAGVHFCASIPNFVALEWHAASVPFFDELVQDLEGTLIQEGYVEVPDSPGLGIDLNLDVAYKYRKPGEAFFDE